MPGLPIRQQLKRCPISNALRLDLDDAKKRLEEKERELGKYSDVYGLIHADPSFGNVLFHDSVPTLIDFDDCGFGHYAYDLAVVLAGAWGKPEYEQNKRALLEHYQEVRPLSDLELSAFPCLMAARAASLIFWAARDASHHSWIKGQWGRLKEYLDA